MSEVESVTDGGGPDKDREQESDADNNMMQLESNDEKSNDDDDNIEEEEEDPSSGGEGARAASARGGRGSEGDEEEEEEKSSDEDSDDGDDDGDSSSSSSEDEEEAADGLSQYERLRLKRIERNNARLVQLGFDKPTEKKEKKKKPPPKPRKSLLPDGPRRQLPGRAKRATFNESATVASAKKERRIEEEKNWDACYTCQKEDGDFTSCDYCRRIFHADCHDPPISPDDAAEFKCTYCKEDGRTRRIACGRCDGCVREFDCMTCPACAKSYGAVDSSRQKCIFRKCQNWGKAKFVRASTGDEDEGMEDGEEEDNHDADCFVCQEGGELICCDGCTKVYHANCHKPKLYDLPDGDWFCMVCCKSKKPAKKKKEKKQKYAGPLVADVVDGRKITCTVRFPKIECIVCEEEEVTGAFKPPDWITCRACDDSYHLNCLDPPLEHRPNKWRCPSCKEQKIKVFVEKEKKKESKPLFEGEHDDDCFMCFQGGDLLCCDYCEKAYHLQCHLPPLLEIPSGLWKCQECAAVEYTRKMKCGECEACLRTDCGKCVPCLDKPKFGGPNKLKQACLKKKCPYLRYAPPTKKGTPKVSKKELKLKFAEGASEKKKKRKRDSPDNAVDQVEANEAGDATQDGDKKKEGRPQKRRKTDQHSTEDDGAIGPDRADLKSVPPTIKKQTVSAEVINKIINGRPLKNDKLGNKIRLVIVKALKDPENSKVQDKALELLRCMATNPDNVSRIVLLGGLKMLSNAMITHPDKTIVQAEASALLAELTWVNPPCIAPIVEEGCLQLVLISMQQHGTHRKVQQMGCGFFRAMSYDFANHRKVDSVNGVSAVIDAMERNPTKYDILKEGCYFLQNMLCNPGITLDTIELFSSKSVIPTVVDAMMGVPPGEAEYLGAACGLLANLAINEGARDTIGKYKSSIPTLLAVLGQDIGVDAKCALNALKLLATGNEDNQAKVVELGGLKAVCDFLKVSSDVALSDAGYRLLVELTRNSKANAQLLAEEGGFELITSTMLAFPNVPFIQASCCGVLRNLPVDTEDTNGIAGLILTAMKKHREDKLVQFEGCHALLQYCCHSSSIAELIQSKELFEITTNKRASKRKRVSTAKRKQTEEPSADENNNIEPMQTSPAKSSKAPLEDEATNKPEDSSTKIESIIKSKPLKDDPIGNKIRLVIVKALKHPENSKLQDKSCEVLRHLTSSARDNASKVIASGGLTMVSKAMQVHPDKTIVQAEASALLAELAWINPSCAAKIVEEGCPQLVLSSMKNHGTHLKVQQMGCGFFRAMSYDFANHQSINEVNGVSAVINAMRRNSNKDEILKEGCYFLQNILCNPGIILETIQFIVSSKIALTIIDSISDNTDDGEYCGAACGLLANLAIDEGAREQISSYDSSVPTLITVLGSGADMDACKCSLNALKHLATGDDGNGLKIVHLGGIQTVLNFLTPPNDVILVDSGLGLLSELIKNGKKNSQLLLDAGGFDFVMKEMEDHSDSSHLQARAISVLCHLPFGTNKACDAVKLIIAAMKNHMDDGLVQYEGCHALLQYCCRFQTTSTELISSGDAGVILSQSHFQGWLAINN